MVVGIMMRDAYSRTAHSSIWALSGLGAGFLPREAFVLRCGSTGGRFSVFFPFSVINNLLSCA